MTARTFTPESDTGRATARDELAGLALGVAFTGLLFLGMAHFENSAPPPPAPEIEDLRLLSAAAEPPPPKIVARQEPTTTTTAPFAGLELGASDSPVKITVVPPDLDTLFPPSPEAPAARIQFGAPELSAKPRMDLANEFQRVFQQNEVDRIPTVMYRAIPKIPDRVRDEAPRLSVVLIIIVDTKGAVASTRTLKSSGNPAFDAIVSQSVKNEWAFTPAIRKGKPVKCLLQQQVNVVWKAGSPFQL